MGHLNYFMGTEMAMSKKSIFISQCKYIPDLLKDTCILAYVSTSTPMDFYKKVGAHKEGTPVDKGGYQRLRGRLVYLSHTWPNIGFFWVSVVS